MNGVQIKFLPRGLSLPTVTNWRAVHAVSPLFIQTAGFLLVPFNRQSRAKRECYLVLSCALLFRLSGFLDVGLTTIAGAGTIPQPHTRSGAILRLISEDEARK